MNPRPIIVTLVLAFGLLPATVKPQSPVQMSVDEYKRGRAYLDAKDYQRAIQHLNNSLAIAPSSAAYMDLGISYYRLKSYPNAIRAFQQVIRTVPNNAEVRLWLSKAHYNLGSQLADAANLPKATLEFANSESEARQAIRIKPDYQPAFFSLGAALFLQKKYPGAEQAFVEALRLDSDDVESLFLLGFTYIRLDKKQAALAVHKKLTLLKQDYATSLLKEIEKPRTSTTSNTASTATPGSAEYYFNEGNKLRDAKSYAKAIESYTKAISLKPTLPNAHLNIGYCHYLVNQYQSALPAFQQAVRVNPGDHSAHYWLGVTYYQLHRYQPALTELQEAVRLKPNDSYAHHWIGETYANGFKQFEKAIPEYREALRLDPDYALAHNQLGLAYSQVEERDDAVAAFKQAMRIKPTEPLYHSNLGLTYVSLGRKEDALAIQRTLQRMDPAKAKALADQINAIFPADKDEPGFLLVFGDTTRYMGHSDSALPIYRRILLLSSEPSMKAAAYRGMGDVYTEKKLSAKASAVYQQALAIYQQLLRQKPNEAYLHYGLAKCYLGLGQKETALRIQRRLTAVDPKYAKDLLDEINKTK